MTSTHILPWQVRAWRRPGIRRALALLTTLALLAPVGYALRARQDRGARDRAFAERVRVLEATIPDQPRMFPPLEEARAGDWRAQHPETAQTLSAYLRAAPNIPTTERTTIYLRAVGPWPHDAADLEALRDFTSAYFQMPVKLGAALPNPKVRHRINEDTAKLQWLTSDLLDALERELPQDAFCVLGITHVDLWPGRGWNFVFGQASLSDRAGVFSFARHEPAFFGEPPGPKGQRLLRDLRVMTHEIGHMFTIRHCQSHQCNMNGTNSLKEADRQPLHLCPVCARKLLHATEFDPIRRHEDLERLYHRHGLLQESDWTRRRLRFLRQGDAR